jgi:hypothetical protein
MRFIDSAKTLLQASEIEDQRQKLDVLKAPAYLRNTFHANGIHYKPSTTLAVKGVEYSFVQDERPACSSWSHILHLVRANVEMLEELAKSSVVSGIDYMRSHTPDEEDEV